MEVKDIVVGSIWKGDLNKDFIAIVDEIICGNYQIDVELTIINTKTAETSTQAFDSMYFIRAYTPLLTREDLNLEYVKGKTDGYNEGYKHGFTLTKEKIAELDKEELESEYQRGLKEGKYLERLDSLNSRQHHYHLGYDDALTRMASEEAENNLELKKQGYEEGYGSGWDDGYQLAKRDSKKSEGFEEGYNTAIKEMKSDKLNSGVCGSNIPNKETQEAMQEVLDKDSNEFSGIWVAKDNSGKLKVLNIDKGICDVELVEYVGDSYLCVGDTTTLVIEDLKEHWIKEYADFEGVNTEDEQLQKELSLVEKYPHYYKDIRHLNIIDIYRFFDIFEVTDPCIQHSMKKMAVGGKRGAKDYEKDIKEAMDTLSRWEYMQEENKRGMND